MRIENIDKNNLKKESDKELFNMRMRFTQIFNKFYKTNLFKKSDFNFLDRKDFLSKYKLLNSEITGRKLKVSKSNELDKVIFSKEMTGVDVRSLPEVALANDYISIHGSFLKSPKEEGSFNIYINDKGDKRTVEVEERVRQLLEEELGKKATVTKSADDIPEDCIPLYDLVLKPIDGTTPREEKKPVAKVDQWGQPKEDKFGEEDLVIQPMSGINRPLKLDNKILKEIIESNLAKESITKPYPSEHSFRLQEPGKYDGFRRTKGGKIYFKVVIPAAIGIIWGHPKGKAPATWIPQALRFPKDKYTVAQAKKFLTDNKIKYIKFEPAKEGAKKEKEEKQKYNCECISCGHKLTTDKHCKDVKCPKCGGTMRRAERPGPGEKYFKFEKIDKKQQIVGGIIYEPDVEDTQGDYMEKVDIEKMAYKYMLGDKKFKINHKGKEYNFPIIESYIPDENTKKGGQMIKKGAWWLMVKVDNKKIWADVESGKLNGFSMGGQAVRE